MYIVHHSNVYVVVQFYPWFIFSFLLFLGMVMYDNEFETKEKKIWTKDKIEPQHIQLFRKRLSEKVHATILKGIVGGFEFTALQRSFKEWHERPWTYVCEC